MTDLDLITRHECEPGKPPPTSPYRDPRGFLTVGIGHNLDAHPLPDEVYPMTQDRVQQVFAADLQPVKDVLAANLPWFASLDPVRQAVLEDMGFNLGLHGMLAFHHTLASIADGDWQGAHDNLMDSQPWVSEVGVRATEDANMLLSGLWPDDPSFPT